MMAAVDVWVNPFTQDAMDRIADSIIQETAEVIGRRDLFRNAGQSPEEFADRMRNLGVETALLPAMKFDGDHNSGPGVRIPEEDVAEICSSYPDRFKGLVGVDPYSGMEGVSRLEEFILEEGFVGAHIVPYGFYLPPNDRRYYPFYAKCVELNVPVLIQIGHTAVRLPNEPGKPKYLDDVVLDFPDLDVVALNIGWPWTNEVIAMVWTHANLYVATTGHSPQYWDSEFVEFIRGRGQDKVMWGTNYPIVDMETSLREVEELNLSHDIEQKLLEENARSVFDI